MAEDVVGAVLVQMKGGSVGPSVDEGPDGGDEICDAGEAAGEGLAGDDPEEGLDHVRTPTCWCVISGRHMALRPARRGRRRRPQLPTFWVCQPHVYACCAQSSFVIADHTVALAELASLAFRICGYKSVKSK